ncbi:hypothetical protein [Thiohalophilus sp.]|uniref:hypothetical protein n=1 Tax=Thiohalophilus sp. TaxID=3028392 RepID=UPI002ACE6F2E|nr:hypothetical protein [Thiohalophilus sp.]MDZ7661140.1 hypothetical protein [Thiohalophilus sp.]
MAEKLVDILILPFGQPLPEVGDQLPLQVEYYDDGDIRYRWSDKLRNQGKPALAG